MNNFIFQNPVKLIFGKGMIARLKDEIPSDKRIMVTYGGGSVKKNGVYEQVCEALKDRYTVEFWGIEPNPSIETLRKAVEIGKKEKIDFVLAVGGGSVVDGSKLIAAGLIYDDDPWKLVTEVKVVNNSVPLAAVLTLPATGSEMNRNSVISRYETKEKYGFVTPYPVFSILDPQTTFTLPKNQIAYGIIDTFIHVMEQYMTVPGISRVMDRWAEGIIHTLIEVAPAILHDSTDYDNMSDFMLAATMGLNGFISMGVPQDWATHMIGHELTALHGLAHGHTLAMVLPGTWNIMRESKGEKIIQYGERIWGITAGSRDERIDAAIGKTEEFFRSLGVTTRLSEEGIGGETIDIIYKRMLERGAAGGENGDVDAEKVRLILECRR